LGRDATSDAGKILTKAGEIPFQYDSAADEAFVEVPFDLHIHDRCLNHLEVHNAGFPSLVADNIVGSPSFVSIVKRMTFVLIELPSHETLSAVNSSFHGPISGLDSPWYSEGTLLGTYFYVKNGTLPDGTISLSTRMIVGTLEDPATGSAASTLSACIALMTTQMHVTGDFSDAGVSPLSTVKFNIEQGVDMGRRSNLRTSVKVDQATHEVCSIVLGGSVVKVMEGHLRV
jgi:predicted PhzF superfamily epimerase YddE/YHI9